MVKPIIEDFGDGYYAICPYCYSIIGRYEGEGKEYDCPCQWYIKDGDNNAT